MKKFVAATVFVALVGGGVASVAYAADADTPECATAKAALDMAPEGASATDLAKLKDAVAKACSPAAKPVVKPEEKPKPSDDNPGENGKAWEDAAKKDKEEKEKEKKAAAEAKAKKEKCDAEANAAVKKDEHADYMSVWEACMYPKATAIPEKGEKFPTTKPLPKADYKPGKKVEEKGKTDFSASVSVKTSVNGTHSAKPGKLAKTGPLGAAIALSSLVIVATGAGAVAYRRFA